MSVCMGGGGDVCVCEKRGRGVGGGAVVRSDSWKPHETV